MFRTFIFILFLLCAGMGFARGLTVSLEPQTVFLGDAFQVIVRMDGEEITRVIPSWSKPVRQGGTSQGVQFINGAMSQTLKVAYFPKEEGTYTLDLLIIETGSGKTLTYKEKPSVVVKPIQADPKVQLTTALATEKIYPGDTVTQTITLRTPYLETTDGKGSPFIERNFFGDLVARQPQLTLSEESSDDLPLRVASNLKRMSTEVDGDQLVWVWALDYRAVRSGTHTLLTPTVNDSYYTLNNGQLTPHRVLVTADPLNVTVTTPPQEGRPTGYTGAICERFTASASLSGHNVAVEDPVLLTIAIEADCDPALLNAPTLPELKGFRTAGEPKREVHEGGCSFTYDLRPTEAGLFEIPALDVAYFKRSTEQYERCTTDLLPLSVKATQQALYLSKDTAPSADLPPVPLLLSQSEPAQTAPRPWAVATLLVGLAAALTRLFARPLKSLASRLLAPLARRRPTAHAKALIHRATTATALAEALRFWAGRPALTATELARILPETDAAKRLVSAFHAIERALYGGEMDLEEVRRTLLEVLGEVPRPRQTTMRVGVALLLVTLPLAMGATPKTFVQEQAEVVTLTAEKPEAFRRATNLWLRVHAEGNCTREVLLNGATCALFAHHPTTAQRLLAQYERLYGRDAQSDRALQITAEQLGAPPSWTATLFRPHYTYGVGERTTALCLVAGVLLLLCAVPVRLQKVRLLLGLLTLALGLSVLTSWVQLWSYEVPTALEESEVAP